MSSPRPRTFSDYLRTARYRKLFIITTALVFAAAAWLALKRVPNLYEASAIITIESKNSEAGDAAHRVNAIQQQLTSRARVESLIEKPGLFDQTGTQGASKDERIAAIQSNIRVSESGANDLRISYRATDPATAAQVVNGFANEVMAEHAKPTAPSSSTETEALRQRALELSARLREMEEKSPWLLAIKDAAPAVAPRSAAPSAEAVRAQQLTIESLKDRQYLIQQQLADIEQRITSVRQFVEQQKKGSSLRDNPTYAALIARRTELQGQRDTLINRQELTDKHPRVAAIIDQIAAINRQIDELRQQDANQASQSPEGRELRSLESDRNRLKLELEINNRELARRSTVVAAQPASPAPARESTSSSPAAQAYFGLKRSYEDVMARLDSAETKLSTAAPSSETLRVAEAAATPQRPVGPPHWLLTLAALGIGLALGAIFAVALESRRFATMQDGRDVELYTRLPLLAAIPKTITDEERKRRSRHSTIRLAVGAVVAVAATAALTAAFIATNIFSLISSAIQS
ncbi:MAG: GumC family protein [Blastocatellia bacterium]